MIFGTVVGLYIVLERYSATRYHTLAPALVLYIILFTFSYLITPEYFLLFLVGFIGFITIIIGASWRILQLPISQRHPHQRQLVVGSVVALGVGVVAWLLENILCDKGLRGLHMHAVFHITCAIGPYLWLTFAAHDRLDNCGVDPILSMECGGLLPVVKIKRHGPAVKYPKRVMNFLEKKKCHTHNSR